MTSTVISALRNISFGLRLLVGSKDVEPRDDVSNSKEISLPLHFAINLSNSSCDDITEGFLNGLGGICCFDNVNDKEQSNSTLHLMKQLLMVQRFDTYLGLRIILPNNTLCGTFNSIVKSYSMSFLHQEEVKK